MTIQEHLSQMKEMYSSILSYISESNSLMNFSSLIKILEKNQIGDNLHLLKTLLHILLNISNDYHRSPTFIGKIEKIIKYFKDKINKCFPNWEIFNIFKSNKRILLFLFEEKIIKMDNDIAAQIINYKYTKRNYHKYFLPEIKPFIDEKFLKNHGCGCSISDFSTNLPENFYEKRKSGENDSFLCEMIRNDSVTEFSSFVRKKKISLDEKIDESIYETNLFLLKNKYAHLIEYNISLIEYAAFFGSVKIFNYLRKNGAKLTPSLWIYAIHSHNAEIIHTLDENKVKPEDESYRECFYESIRCHNKDIANYFISIFLNEKDKNAPETAKRCLKYYNFDFAKSEFINELFFIELCQYDHYLFVDSLLNKRDFDVNKIIIYNTFVSYNLK
ncbi:hypothetical protein M9Y10_018171 [Tritrichomonas musculus]|uniref:DUF3447 domain-containing protein n=1 Tax=Tritrichomonas musculus TaxID=1915356 RepID=A0ABR2HMX9_9EUKA